MSEILENLKHRSRPVVAERDAQLMAPPLSEPSTSTDPSANPVKPQRKGSRELKTQLEQLPVVADRRQIRLEVGIDLELERLCKQQPKGKRITVETFLEAAYLACKQDPLLRDKIMAEAAQRLAVRKRAGKLRRLQSQLEAEI